MEGGLYAAEKNIVISANHRVFWIISLHATE